MMAGAGALNSALSAGSQARAQKSALGFQADMDAINAQQTERQAESTLAAGQAQEQRSRLETAQLKSTQRAAFAANGIDVGEGSAAQVLTSTDVMGEIDANTLHANAVQAAFGYRTQAINERGDARAKRAAADAISPGAAFTNTLIGGASQVATSWYTMNKAGAFDAPKAPTVSGSAGGTGLSTAKASGFWGS